MPKRNVLDRAKFLQQPSEEEAAAAAADRRSLSPRPAGGGGNVMERAKFLQQSPTEAEKECKAPAVDIPRGNVLEKAQFLQTPKDSEAAADKASSDIPRGKVLEKAQFLQQAPQSSMVPCAVRRVSHVRWLNVLNTTICSNGGRARSRSCLAPSPRR